MSNNFRFLTSANDVIRITTLGIENLNSSQCIIYVHGFKGFKDWGFVPYTCEYFAKNGFFVISFNFSHNGVGEELTEFTEMEKFAENTYSLEITELSEIINAYSDNFFGKTKNDKIGLLGHSRGGAISLLTSVNKKEIGAVALWASISKIDRYTERLKKEWEENGYIEVLNTRTNQLMRLNVSLLRDIEKNNNDKLNIEKAARELKRPLFIAQGEEDMTVPFEEAEKLYEWSDKSVTEFFRISGTGHTFGTQHPFTGSNPKFERLLEKTTDFFKYNFS
jgi:dipeptidyl aminopeptidase/acylaminoacyl peptidase